MPWYIPVLIFFARISDVSIGTLRIILTVRGKMVISAILGFLEVTIWVLAISGVLKYLSHPLAIISYGAGFSTGIILGIQLEKTFVSRFHTIRAINTDPEIKLAKFLREMGYAVTEVQGKGRGGNVEICLITVSRNEVSDLQNKIMDQAPKTFIAVEDVLETLGGVKRPLYSKLPAWFRIGKTS